MRIFHPGAIAALTTVALLSLVAPALAATLHSGTWTKKSASAEGTWTIVEEDGVRYVDLSADFKTKNAPDLKLFFSPKPVSELKNKNATDDALFLTLLTSHEGAQRYEIPASVDLSAYTSILIHCEKYTKLWCAAPL